MSENHDQSSPGTDSKFGTRDELYNEDGELEDLEWERRPEEFERHQRALLDDIFGDEFHPEDPPESFTRFERQLAMQRLTKTVYVAATGVTEYRTEKDEHRSVLDMSDTRKKGVAIVNPPEEQSDEVAEKAIDILATYGEEAEPFLSAIASGPSTPEEHRLHALEELREIRCEKGEESKSLSQAIRDWWHS